MRHAATLLMTLCLTSALGACSTKLAVGQTGEITKTKEAQPTKVGGIPFRVAKAHMVHLYAYDEAKDQYEKISSEKRVIASPDKVYFLTTDREMLSDGKLAIKLRANGTLETVNVTSTNRILGTADAALSEIDKLSTAAEARDAAEETAAKTKRDANLACVEARVGLSLAQEALDALTEETPAIDRVRAEGDVLIAEVKQRNACILE